MKYISKIISKWGDLIVFAVILVNSFILFSHFNVLEVIVALSSQYEHLEIDELFSTSIVFSLGCLFFLFRRWKESTRARSELEESKALLQQQVQSLDTLNRVNEVLKNDELSIDEAVRQIGKMLPKVFKDTENIAAEISFDGQLYEIEGFDSHSLKMSKDIRTAEDDIGQINIFSDHPELKSTDFENYIFNEIVDRLRGHFRAKKYRDHVQTWQELFRRVLDSIDANIYVADMKSHEILFVNKQLKDKVGDVVGKICWQALHQKKDGPCLFCIDELLLDEDGNPGDVNNWEYKDPTNGKWYLVKDRAIHWVEGQIVRLQVATDVSENRQFLKALQLDNNIMEHLSEGVALVKDNDRSIVYANPSLGKIIGCDFDNLIGKSADILFCSGQRDPKAQLDDISEALRNHGSFFQESEFYLSGHKVWVQTSHSLFDHWEHGLVWISIIQDITKRKLAEQETEHSQNTLEEMVEKRSKELKESNIALKRLLQEKDQTRSDIEANLFYNVNSLIQPYIDKLRGSGLDERQVEYLDLIDASIENITSQFVRDISTRYLKLTSAEIKVADLVKHGRSTKEISNILNLSPDTINNHRKSIRKKLGLKNKNESLRTKLLSLKD